MAEADNSETEDLCDQLSRQNEALDQVKQEIKEWEKAKTEYQEIVIQMQNKGIFLGVGGKQKSELRLKDLLKLEIEGLQLQIQALNKDVKSMNEKWKSQQQPYSHQDNLIDDNGKNQEFDDLVLLMAKAEQDQCVLERENETLTEEIETLKTNLKSRTESLNFDLDQLIQESLSIKQRLQKETQQTQEKFKDIKINKSKLKNTTTIDKLEMPLRFLRQNEDRRLKHLSLGHEAYLRNLTLALLESMVVKDKLVRNYQAQNINLSLRLVDLTENKNPKDFYDPHEVMEKSPVSKEVLKHPIV